MADEAILRIITKAELSSAAPSNSQAQTAKAPIAAPATLIQAAAAQPVVQAVKAFDARTEAMKEIERARQREAIDAAKQAILGPSKHLGALEQMMQSPALRAVQAGYAANGMLGAL